MAFLGLNMKSLVAGAAKRGSERLKALETETKDLIKTKAEKLRAEMEATRKQRTSDLKNYQSKARQLRKSGLNNAQIETILSGGVDEGYADFTKAMQNAANTYLFKNKTIDGFDEKVAAQSLFNVTRKEGATSIGDIDKQAQAYSFERNPYTGQTYEEAANDISKTLGKGILGNSPTSYIVNELNARKGRDDLKREDEDVDYSNFGDTGIGFSSFQPSADALLKFQEIEGQIKATEAGTEATKAGTKLTQLQTKQFEELAPLKKQELEQNILLQKNQNKQLKTSIDLATEQLDVFKKTKPDRIKKFQLEVDNFSNEIDLNKARLETEKLNQKRLNQQIASYSKYGDEEMRLNNALLQEKIYATGRPDDVEAYQTSLLMEKKRLTEALNKDPDGTEINREDIANQIKFLDETILNNARIMADADKISNKYSISSEVISKMNPDSYFNSALDSQFTALGLDAIEGDAAAIYAALKSKEEDPTVQIKILTAFQSAVKESENLFEGIPIGDRFANVKRDSLNRAIATYAENLPTDRTDTTKGGVVTEVKNVNEYAEWRETAKPGDVAKYTGINFAENSPTDGFSMIGSGNNIIIGATPLFSKPE